MPAAAPAVSLTEKLLIAAGGWEVLRHARALRETGKVSGAQWSPPVLQGSVQGDGREYRAGLKIITHSNVENLCTCRPSREYGTICAHSVAVGLAVLAGQTPPAAPAPARPAAPSAPVLPYRADPAATARLHIVLAPDLPAAWAKGQLLVGLELATPAGRAMLGAAGQGNAALLPEDFRVVETIARLTGALPGGMQFLAREPFLELAEGAAGHPRLTLGRANTLSIESEPLRPPLRASLLPGGALELAVQWPEGSRVLTAGTRTVLWRPGTARATLQTVAPGLPAAYRALFEQPAMRLPAGQADAFLSLEWPRLAPFFDLRADALPAKTAAPAASSTLSGVEPGTPQFTATVEGSLKQLGARLQALYPNRRLVTVGLTPERETFTYPAPDAPAGTLHTRHPAAERAALARFTEWGFAGPDTTGHFFLRGEDAVVRFFAQGLPAIQRLPGWQVSVGARFQQASRDIEIITPEVAVLGSGTDWFELEIALTGSSGERFPAGEIQRLLQMGSSHARLRNGKLAVLPADTLNDLQEVLRDCDPAQPRPGVYRLGRTQGAYLDESLAKWGVATAPSWNDWKEKQGAFRRVPDAPLPPGLAEIMRSYQREGTRWLGLLAGNGLGGILADEMGLGKTLQALAWLASSPLHPSSLIPHPSLVVCPTSLVDNWKREAEKFTPGLKTLAIDGPDRAPLFDQIPAAGLVITSYALLRRDLEKYRAREFTAVVLDEAHHIKNPDSQVAQAACALRSRHRFVLTGTPMENSVRDLWSILRFALPGYLGSRQDFRERYEQPLSRPGDPAADAVRERLTRRLRPVLLRRLKKDVAAELPARIEQTAFCDLTPAQTAVYRQLLEQSRLKLDNARREKNPGAGRMLVLTALLRLRQACCDLRLLGLDPNASGVPIVGRPSRLPTPDALHPSSGLGGTRQHTATGTVALQPEDTAPANSAKLALLDELLEEIREGGHRVLIFSQFVSMLKLLAAHLDAAGTPFCYLDGSTKPRDRAAQVERFQTDASQTAFLISVKAGGTGLNLTGADTVIHFDPWWNPAVEAQATDRAHRLGQTRVVTAYRLIARGTVEEKIFALQNRKRELTASLVEREKDEPLLETLSFEEIEGLLD